MGCPRQHLKCRATLVESLAGPARLCTKRSQPRLPFCGRPAPELPLGLVEETPHLHCPATAAAVSVLLQAC